MANSSGNDPARPEHNAPLHSVAGGAERLRHLDGVLDIAPDMPITLGPP